MIKTFGNAAEGYVVSDHGVWVPGIYDSPESARLAVRGMEDRDIEAFLEHIYAVDGENRPVTVADIQTAVRLAES